MFGWGILKKRAAGHGPMAVAKVLVLGFLWFTAVQVCVRALRWGLAYIARRVIDTRSEPSPRFLWHPMIWVDGERYVAARPCAAANTWTVEPDEAVRGEAGR